MRIKSNLRLRLDRRFHELLDCLKDDSKFAVMLFFKRIKPSGQVLIGGDHFAQLDEGPHDGDVDLDGAFAMQDAGKHGDALLGKGVRRIFDVLAPL